MAVVKSFEELTVFQESLDLAEQLYQASDTGTFSRDFALRDQIRRAAISVMSNIAEGFESQTKKVFIRHLGYAKGSAGEIRAQLLLAERLGYLGSNQAGDLRHMCKTISRRLSRLISYLNQDTQHL